jgi:hypothetical protein
MQPGTLSQRVSLRVWVEEEGNGKAEETVSSYNRWEWRIRPNQGSRNFAPMQLIHVYMQNMERYHFLNMKVTG